MSSVTNCSSYVTYFTQEDIKGATDRLGSAAYGISSS
jgi:hypothetical protein